MNYIVKSLLAILFLVLTCRDFFRLLGRLKNTPNGKIKAAGICVLTVLLAAAAVILLTLFEFSLLLVLLFAVWLFRKKLSVFAKNTLCKKNGKFKLAGISAAAAFALWFGLALFYRTDIGMPIGVQNYLYHKYWEEFEVSGFFGATVWGHPTNQLTCCPKNGDPQTDSFNVARKNTLSVGSRLFASDNYYGILIREDYENYISTFIDDYFDDFKVYAYFDSSGLSNVKYMSDSLNKNTSLDEFLKYQQKYNKSCNWSDIHITLYADKFDENELQDIFMNIVNDVSIKISDASIFLTVINDQDEYNLLNMWNLRKHKFDSEGIRFISVLGKYQNDISIIQL